VRKALGVAGLLALLVVPLTGSAGATTKTDDPTKVCALVKVAADVKAGANIGLYGKVLKKDGLNAVAAADVDGHVFAYICVKVDKVALKLHGDLAATASTKCGYGKTGVDLKAFADLATGLQGGSVKVFVKVFADADGTVDALNIDAEAEAKALIKVYADLNLAALTTIKGQVIADLNLCVDVDVDVNVEVGDDDKKY
jgi:hypothetical protein